MASTILSESDACEWWDRLEINMNIMEFSDIYRSAQAFSNCNLSVNSIAHSIFNLRHLLKKWVLVRIFFFFTLGLWDGWTHLVMS